MMLRPKVVVIMMASVDGKIATAPGRNVTEWAAMGIDGGANEAAHRLSDDLDCDGLVSGSDSVLVYGNHPVQLSQPLYWPQKSRAYIVFDGKGRIEWAQSTGLMVITRCDVSEVYLDQLRAKQIDFIQVGRGDHVDLQLALDALYQRGFRKLALMGGGTLNGAFLRSGFVDEISILIAPCVVGGTSTPSTFDCPDLMTSSDISRTKLLNIRQMEQGVAWLHYQVLR